VIGDRPLLGAGKSAMVTHAREDFSDVKSCVCSLSLSTRRSADDDCHFPFDGAVARTSSFGGEHRQSELDVVAMTGIASMGCLNNGLINGRGGAFFHVLIRMKRSTAEKMA
jgi:hypothetical protein